MWPCVVNSRVWWLTGKEKHPSPSFLWYVFSLVSCEACWWGLTQHQQEEVLGHPIVLPSGKPTCNLKLLQASLACIELWLAGDTTYMSERKTIWSFSCVHQLPSAIMRMLDDESRLTQDTLFVERFPRSWIHRMWFPSKPIQVLELFVLWHTHKYWFFSCSQCFNRIRAGAYMQKDSYSDHARWYFLNPFSGSWCCAQPHLNKSCCV